MSQYAKRNPENPHGLQGGHHPQPPSKYAGLTPEEVLDRMAQDNAQNQRFVEHGNEMVEAFKLVLSYGVFSGFPKSKDAIEKLVAKVEGK